MSSRTGPEPPCSISREERSDRLELRRWPGVHVTDLCGRFDWKCQRTDCREPCDPRTQADQEAGAIYCSRHDAHWRAAAA